eukprot:226145_1
MLTLLLLILFETISLKSQEIGCTFTPDGTNITYDLSGLSHMGRLKTTDESNTALTYYFSICRNLTGDVCTEQYPGIGCAQQWTDGKCSYWLSAWEPSMAHVRILNSSNPYDGITVEFDNGEKCKSSFGVIKPYKTLFVFVCDPSTKYSPQPAHVDQGDSCLYEIIIKSRFACAGDTPDTGTNSSFSIGFVIIIAFFGAIIIGLILYYILLGIKTKNWGTESMAPPLNVCRYFWVYTCVGCKVSIIWVRYKLSKHEQPSGIGSLNDDNLIDTDD